ncbi:unnamed protein product [Staurois parvus]|uniref:G-protein coupled receptors family 1 profile domain-containing protein n=1 Tax=Staurois parvus TaxID=386267 RepID=A0ABN9GDD5_9NEOB|nr:unnamed protein product [Staurois parvus]
MCEDNHTEVTVFLLLGFQGLYKFKILFFTLFLLLYVVILNGNLLIIVLISIKEHLKIPMFFFLKHLAIADLLISTSVVPMMLDIILKDEGDVSLVGCIIQLYCFAISGSLQSFLIAVMSFDRYLAICNPLRYSSLMNPHVISQLIIGLWVLVIILLSSEVIELFQFKYCGPNSIDHFFCDFSPVVELSTSDTSLMLQDFFVSIVTIFLPFAFIIITYTCISVTILKISSTSGRRKAFSTCSSHLTVVCAYYGALIIVYVAPPDDSSINMNKYRSLLYMVVSPLKNPMIYSLRNHEIKRALQKMMATFKTFCT